MEKPLGTGLLIYSVAISIIALLLLADWQKERGDAKRALSSLYSVCESLKVMVPILVAPLPIPQTGVEGIAQAKNPTSLHRSTVYMACSETYAEEFDRIRKKR